MHFNFVSSITLVGLMLSFTNHGCAPNVWPVDRDGETVYIALRTILVGERLSVDFYGFHWNSEDKHSHEEHGILKHWENREATADEIESLTTDQDYQFISSHNSNFGAETMDNKTFYMLKKMCGNVLRKFGLSFWMPQLKIVSDIYAKILTIEFNGTLTKN